MNASIGCLGLGMIVLFFVTMIFLRESNKHIAKLKEELNEAIKYIHYIRKDMMSMDDDLERTKGTLNVEISKSSKELNYIKKKLEKSEKSIDIASHLKGIEGSLKGMLDIVEREHTDAVKWRSEAAERQIKAFCEYNDASGDSGDDDEPYTDIHGDLDDGFEGEESATEEQREALEYASKKVKYEWIFPSSDSNTMPIVGCEYLVIGRTCEGNDIVSDVGTWKGLYEGVLGGFDMSEGYKFDKVFAYIRLPSPIDVMEKVIDIQLKG